jgi:hypothetical protein
LTREDPGLGGRATNPGAQIKREGRCFRLLDAEVAPFGQPKWLFAQSQSAP